MFSNKYLYFDGKTIIYFIAKTSTTPCQLLVSIYIQPCVSAVCTQSFPSVILLIHVLVEGHQWVAWRQLKNRYVHSTFSLYWVFPLHILGMSIDVSHTPKETLPALSSFIKFCHNRSRSSISKCVIRVDFLSLWHSTEGKFLIVQSLYFFAAQCTLPRCLYQTIIPPRFMGSISPESKPSNIFSSQSRSHFRRLLIVPWLSTFLLFFILFLVVYFLLPIVFAFRTTCLPLTLLDNTFVRF